MVQSWCRNLEFIYHLAGCENIIWTTFKMMKNKIIPYITNNVQCNNFQSEVKMQQSEQYELKPHKKSKPMQLAMTSLCVSLVIIVIPIIWIIFMCITGKTMTDYDMDRVQRNTPDLSRSATPLYDSDKFGYHVIEKIPEYREVVPRSTYRWNFVSEIHDPWNTAINNDSFELQIKIFQN